MEKKIHLSSIDLVLMKGHIILINTNQQFSYLEIPPGHYISSRGCRYNKPKNPERNFQNFALHLYKQVHPQKAITNKQAINIKKAVAELLTNKRKTYLNYKVRSADKNLPLVKSTPLKTEFLDFTQENQKLDFIASIAFLFEKITLFYQIYLPNCLSNWSQFLQNQNLNSNQISSLKPLSRLIKQAEAKDFTNFSTKSDLQNCLKTSSSIYHKMCLFFSLNPITVEWANVNNILCQEHHIYPVYLKNIYGELNNISMNVRFNIIYVPCFLYAIRFLVFGYSEDLNATKVLYHQIKNQQKDNNNKTNNENFLTILFQDISHWIKNPRTSSELYTNKKTLKNFVDNQSTETPTIYENEMLWKNYIYTDIPDLVIPAKTINLHSEMIERLINHLKQWLPQNHNPGVKKPNGWENYSPKNQSSFISKYLNGLNQKKQLNSAFWGFYLKTFENKMLLSREMAFIKKSRKASNSYILNLIDQGGYQWVNNKHKKSLTLHASPFHSHEMETRPCIKSV